MIQSLKDAITESRMNAIDKVIDQWDKETIPSRLLTFTKKLRSTLKLYNKYKDNENIEQIRKELQKKGKNLTAVLQEGYYWIEKIKEHIYNIDSIYTLAHVEDDALIEKIEIKGVRNFFNTIATRSGKTASSNGSLAILSGNISFKETTSLEVYPLLYQYIYKNSQQQLNNGQRFELYEMLIDKGYKDLNLPSIIVINDLIPKAKLNIPFFKINGDVNGRQIKTNGFTICKLQTIETVLSYIIRIFSDDNKNIRMEALKELFENDTPATTTYSRLDQLLEHKIQQEIEKSLFN